MQTQNIRLDQREWRKTRRGESSEGVGLKSETRHGFFLFVCELPPDDGRLL
jgi:hypothetical protein